MNIDDLKKYKEQYIKSLISDRKSNATITSYSNSLNKMISYIEQNFEGEFKAKTAILEYIDSLGEEEHAESTINTWRSPVRSLISFMRGRDYIDEDFGGNIGVLKEDNKPKEVLEPEEIEKIFDVLASELNEARGYDVFYKARNLMLFTFLLHTGVRRGEVVKVKFTDIDFIKEEITIYGKGNKTRIIPLVPDLKQQLYSYRDLLEQLDRAGYNVKSEYLFRSEKRNKTTKLKDKPMTPKNVEIIIKDICNKAGIEKNISPHNIRHTFVSYGIKNEMSLPSLAEIAGHAKLSTLLDIYAHEISMDERKKEMSKINFKKK